MKERFKLQDFERFDLTLHQVGLCIAATLYVSDARESELAPDLLVRVIYEIESRSVHDACALGLLTRAGHYLPFTDPVLGPELTAWAAQNLELFKRCEQVWEEERQAAALAVLESQAEELKEWRHVG